MRHYSFLNVDMTQPLLEKYQAMLAGGTLVDDALQRGAVEQLSQREHAFYQGQHSSGLYLHGRVGRGKTLLMDMFYQSLETPYKIRLHFHHFMFLVHQKLKQIQGQVDPLEHIAKELASQAKVICFDEFFVNDIADAMLLGGIFNALHQHGVMIVATSNTAPDDLYAGGLARDRFVPTIALIKQHLSYYSLDGDIDYRTTFTHYNPVYFVNERESFERYVTAQHIALDEPSTITIYNRELNILGQHQQTIWFDFMALCDGPRSQNDYILLADSFEVLILSDVVVLGGKVEQVKQVKGTEDGDTNYLIMPAKDIEIGHLDDCARRFIALVDEFYDRDKLVVISSDTPMLSLYQGGRVSSQFERTYSRLTEMQSIDYQRKVKLSAASVAAKMFADI